VIAEGQRYKKQTANKTNKNEHSERENYDHKMLHGALDIHGFEFKTYEGGNANLHLNDLVASSFSIIGVFLQLLLNVLHSYIELKQAGVSEHNLKISWIHRQCSWF